MDYKYNFDVRRDMVFGGYVSADTLMKNLELDDAHLLSANVKILNGEYVSCEDGELEASLYLTKLPNGTSAYQWRCDGRHPISMSTIPHSPNLAVSDLISFLRFAKTF